MCSAISPSLEYSYAKLSGNFYVMIGDNDPKADFTSFMITYDDKFVKFIKIFFNKTLKNYFHMLLVSRVQP